MQEFFSFAAPSGEKPDWHEALSAFHKELRRGDLSAARYWAGQVGRGANSYLLSVVMEETSNWSLLKYCLLNPGLENRLAAFTGTAKHWDIPSASLFLPFITAVVKAHENGVVPQEWSQSQPPDGFWQAKESGNISMWAAEFYRYRLESKNADRVWRTLAGPEYGFVPTWGFFEQLGLIRSLCLPGEAPVSSITAPVDDTYRPVPLYALDKHTRRGRDLLVNIAVEPEVPQPANVDLRWSGGMPYVLWRIKAAAGPGLDSNWEEVPYPRNDFIIAQKAQTLLWG